MPAQVPHVCQCPACRSESEHPDKAYHRQVGVFLSMLNRHQRKLFAAVESSRHGRGGDVRASLITGLAEETVRSGRRQMGELLAGRPLKKPVWRAGRPRIELKHPGIIAALEEMLADDVAGDPMGACGGSGAA
jgi:hypothetical protein